MSELVGRKPLGKGKTNHGFYNSGRKYRTRVNTVKTKACSLWENIRVRCQILSELERFEKYKVVGVVEEWKDFQVFAEWFEVVSSGPYYKEGWELDKDLLSDPDNKLYGPNTCVFIPQELNRAMQEGKKRNLDLPIGVSQRTNATLETRYSCGDETFYVRATFDNNEVDKAAALYKEAKQKYLNHLCDKYKDNLDPRVIEKLLSYNGG